MLLTVRPTKLRLVSCPTQNKSAYQVRLETGADIVINAWLFDASHVALCDVKANGKVLHNDADKYWGFAWNSDEAKPALINDISKKENFLSHVALIKDGKALTLRYNAQIAGNRQRTAIGFNASGEMVILCQKSPGLSVEATQKLMLKAGCVDAINLDGGASSQLSSAMFGSISGGRKVKGYLCIWIKKTANTCPYPMPTRVIRRGCTGNDVKWVQWHLCRVGHNIDIDGSFGPLSVSALREFQLSSGLFVDGWCGPATRAALKEAVSESK